MHRIRFRKIPGVLRPRRATRRPAAQSHHEQVSGGTGHIEAVRVTYDPARVSYATLAARFIRTVDPFDSGGSFCDRGYGYRAAFFVTPAQRRVAESVKTKAQASLRKPIATLVLPAATFYPAETYHPDYYKKNPSATASPPHNAGAMHVEAIWG